LEPATDEPGAFIIDGDPPIGEIVGDVLRRLEW
jgi:hypothetical protein